MLRDMLKRYSDYKNPYTSMREVPRRLEGNYKNLLHFLHDAVKSKFKKNQRPEGTGCLRKNPVKITHFEVLILKWMYNESNKGVP